MILPQLLVVAAADVATPTAADAVPAAVDMQTALLVVVAVILVFLFKTLADVRNRLDRMESALASKGHGDREPAGDDDERVPDQVVAVIAASVVATVGRAHRIVALHPVSPEARAWSLEGRRQVFQSHQIR